EFLQEHQYQATVIALPAFKQNDLNVHEFKKLTSTPTYLISTKILIDLQPKCSHFSEASYRHIGLGAVAEACVLALMNKNDRLLIPKIIYNKIT
ncbi:cobalamin biosynthesis protein, partial [Ochrobactrum soli]